MDECLIGYIDLLGFSSVVEDGGADELILGVLKITAGLAEVVKELSDAKGQEVGKNPYPKISAFSDHIVLSYRLNGQSDPSDLVWAFGFVAAKIAEQAIPAGCLIRGAITVGPLHHDDHVIFGTGLIEAYQTEAKVAHYPRVIVTEKAAKLVDPKILGRDDDGLKFIDYMQIALGHSIGRIAVNGEAELEHAETAIREWVAQIRHSTDERLAKLAGGNNQQGLRYWHWFRTRFDRMVSKTAPTLFPDDQPPPGKRKTGLMSPH